MSKENKSTYRAIKSLFIDMAVITKTKTRNV